MTGPTFPVRHPENWLAYMFVSGVRKEDGANDRPQNFWVRSAKSQARIADAGYFNQSGILFINRARKTARSGD